MLLQIFTRPPRWIPCLLAGLTAAALAGAAYGEDAADVPGGPGLRLSGFGTVGLSHVQAPDGWGYRRELTQGGSDASWRSDVDTRLGVQLNYSLGSRVELVAQVIAKKRAIYTRDSDALEWAYVAYRPDADWTLRAGRLNLDAFLMADYRNVGYGFMPARPPVELYSVLPTTLDGVDIARSWFQGDSQWRAKLMIGEVRIGDFHSDMPAVGDIASLMLSREEGGLLLRASFSRTRIRLDHTFSQGALDALGQLGALPIPVVAGQALALRERLGPEPVWANYLDVGLRYELGNWQWSAEIAHTTALPVVRQTAAYAIVGYRFGDWTPYVGYGQTRSKVSVLPSPVWQPILAPLFGPVVAAQAEMLGRLTTDGVNRVRGQQSSWSLGVRWDLHPQAALKLQWDRVRVDAHGTGLWTGGDGQAGRAHVASAVVDFIF